MKTEYYVDIDPSAFVKCANGDCQIRNECLRATKKSCKKQIFNRFEPENDFECSFQIEIPK